MMKTNNTFKHIVETVLLILTISLMFGFSASARYYYDRDYEYYKDSETLKIIDNVVYYLESNEKGKNPYYKVISFGATKKIRAKTTEINIVDEIDGIPVTAIEMAYKADPLQSDYGVYAYAGVYPNVKELKIPDSITYIGGFAFSGLINVETIELPPNLKELGYGAFGFMDNLKEVVIPKGVERIPNSAFRESPKLEKVVFEGQIKEIGSNAFSDCESLKYVTPCNELEYISLSAFRRCKNLKSFPLASTLKKIWPWAFAGSGLTSVKIPESVVLAAEFDYGDDDAYYGEQFANCKNLKSVIFEKRKTPLEIPQNCFARCENLKTITMQKGIKKIGPAAFKETGIASVKIPSDAVLGQRYYYYDEVRARGEQFKDCKNLKSVVFENRKSSLVIPPDCFTGCTKLKTVELPKSTKGVTLCTRAFYNCTSLKRVENPGVISGIRSSAFKNCKSLESIKFSSKIKYIETRAFKGCSKLKSVTFKDTKKVPANTFEKEIKHVFDKDTFSGTPNAIKFFVKNETVAKKLKTALKGSGVKNAGIYKISGSKLYYKNVK